MSHTRTDPAPPTLSPETRDRLLDAAGEVFAEFGFRRATVRDICRRAEANVAAVNYHFGDKGKLYAEVMRYGVRLALQKYPVDMGLEPGREATAEERLRAFVRSFLYRLLNQGPYAWQGKLMLWEMTEPTEFLGTLFQETIRPLYQRLQGIVRELLGPAATEARVQMGCASVLGQCSFYRTGAALLAHAQPGAPELSDERIEAIAGHVARFTAAGLRSFAADSSEGTEGAERP